MNYISESQAPNLLVDTLAGLELSPVPYIADKVLKLRLAGDELVPRGQKGKDPITL